MTTSPLSKAFFISACIGGSLFAVANAPLALWKSQTVQVQVQNRVVFESELNDVSGPYLGIAGALSGAVGLGIFGVTGWRFAATKIEEEEARKTQLEKDLQTHEARLEQLTFSDTRLQAGGLESFLEKRDTPVVQSASVILPKAPLSLVQPAEQPPTAANLQIAATADAASAQELSSLLQQLQVLTEKIEAKAVEAETFNHPRVLQEAA